MCARRSENILLYFFADNFTSSKDTYNTDVSFLCQYIKASHTFETTKVFIASVSKSEESCLETFLDICIQIFIDLSSKLSIINTL